MKTDINPKGRKLDRLVAEKVMGWELRPVSDVDDDHGYEMRWFRKDGAGWSDTFPAYSTDIREAWKVVEQIKQLATLRLLGSVDLCIKVGLGDNAFCEIFEMSPMGYVGQEKTFEAISVDSWSASEAICLAALRVVQIGEGK